MAGKPNNRRTQMTKKMIREAFIELLQKKELSSISVTEIANAADINRGTFYKYYKDPYDLLQKLENELTAELLANVQVDNVLLEFWLEDLLTVLQNNRSITNFILLNSSSRNIIGALLEQVKPEAFQRFIRHFHTTSNEELELYLSYFVAGSIGMIEKWLRDFPSLTPARVTQLLIKAFVTNVYENPIDT